MSDDESSESPKEAEQRLRSRAAAAFRYEKPMTSLAPAFERFEITEDQQAASEKAKKDLEAQAKARFKILS